MSIASRVPIQIILKRYAGHSKWANIKHIKAAKDAQKSALFTKISRQIKVAIQEGGSSNPDTNLRLSQIIDQAKRNSMPVASIQNVIKSTQMKKDGSKSGLLEIRGPAGCMILCEIFSDNITRSKQTIATILRKHSVSFSDGGGRHLFEQKGVIEVQRPEGRTEDELTEHAIESGAEDVKLDYENIRFICEPRELKTVQTNLENLKYNIVSSDVEYLPIVCVQLDESHLENLSSLFDKLESHNDVVKLYDNVG